MSLVDGKGLVTWEGGLFEPNSDLLRRVQWAFGRIREDGGTIILNEAGRPFGVPGDANVRYASQTASGVSTVWFQWGRYLRGETPSAADPRSGNVYASEHTQGIATDTNAPTVFDMTLRAKYFGMVGMFRTIASESWHFAIRRDPEPGISLAGFGATTITNDGAAVKPEEDYTMTQGAFFRLGADQVALGSIKPGSILWQSDIGEPLMPVSDVEWRVWEANHNTYKDLTTQQMQAAVNTVGLYDVDTRGRRQVAGSVPGHPARNGFSVYLP